jgi:hypothetical protein
MDKLGEMAWCLFSFSAVLFNSLDDQVIDRHLIRCQNGMLIAVSGGSVLRNV